MQLSKVELTNFYKKCCTPNCTFVAFSNSEIMKNNLIIIVLIGATKGYDYIEKQKFKALDTNSLSIKTN